MLNSPGKQFFKIEVGAQVTDGTKAYRVSNVLSVDSVLAVELATNTSHRLAIDALKLVDDESGVNPSPDKTPTDRDLQSYSDKEWAEIKRRHKIIQPLIDNRTRTRQEVERIAAVNNVHATTIYRWLDIYTKAGHISALAPGKRGRKSGTTLLDATLETIVQSTIEDFYLNDQRGTPQKTVEEVEKRCRLARIAPPHPNTVRQRIYSIPNKVRLRRRGRKDEATNLYAPIRGSFPGADYPFAFVQIDHTPADIICVDDVHRKPVGRPFLTLAIDVHSRMVGGLYLSYDPPSAASVALCLAQVMCSKSEYLARLDVPGRWPVWGRIGTVHCDNAKEFRGAVLERGCAEYAIDLAWRPVKVPRYGGHIESLMGNVAKELHILPGTTFSNIAKRKGYDSEGKAALTLKELERHMVDYFVNVYHQKIHSQIGMSPFRKWEMGLEGSADRPGSGLMPLPNDPERITLDFLPFVERTVQPYGLLIDKINYYDPVLDPYINAAAADDQSAKRRFIIRRDPRDISRVYFFDPQAKRYTIIPYRNLGHPPMSLYELTEVRRRLKAEGRKDVDETLIFEAVERMRARVDEAVQKSKAARRHLERTPRSTGPSGASAPSKSPHSPQADAQPAPPNKAITAEVSDNPFAEPVEAFDDVSLTR